MFFRNSVRSAVVKVIDSRIKYAQKKYEFSIKELFADTRAKIKALMDEQKTKQEVLLNECVNSVISPEQVR